ncbi:hypothetical protein Clacol_002152 [Clathrus columnatus]|uniref:Uncharacterized protein n=1 Tax=Clathrus columnatus TaxID=1419009 RepID=A0AAV5A7R2_9AGAM|nr:hypothetical protein Clacol_002152 [Clathrus columnatus]
MEQPYVHFQLPPLPYQLRGLPNTAWGIAYDIYTPATENDLPYGWNSHRANTYKQLISILVHAGYLRSQYSDYLHSDTDAHNTWQVMMELMSIDPVAKMETTVKGLKMYTMNHVHVQDVTHQVRLGGQFAARLRGQAPRLLVRTVRLLLDHLPQPLANLIGLPRHTRPSPAANTPGNWVA